MALVVAPLKPQEERVIVKNLIDSKLKVGDTWFVISYRWWRSWKEFTLFDRKDDEVADQLASLDLNNSADRPGPIDNSDITTNNVEIRVGCQEGYDYVVIPRELHEKLAGWYGINGPSFERQVISLGQGLEQVEVFPRCLNIVRASAETGEPELDKVEKHLFSRRDTLQAVVDKLSPPKPAQPLGAAPKATTGKALLRLWLKVDKDGQKVWKAVNGLGLSSALETLDLSPEDVVLAETRKEDGSWPRAAFEKNFRDFEIGDDIDCKDSMGKWYESTIRDIKDGKVLVHFKGWQSKWDEWLEFNDDRMDALSAHTDGAYIPQAQRMQQYASTAGDSYYSFSYNNEEGTPIQKGVVGLRNLGNTCFMNSTLQCLSNTPQLTDFFLTGRYLAQINRDNPLGWQGKIAEEWGTLLQNIWGGKYRTVAPRGFKQVIGEFQPRFSGYQQQDSSELLSFLLDGLHEDLNLVKKKPATENKEGDGRPDEEVAAEAWATHQLRNQSVVVDLCQGQLKSKLVCPRCDRVSITFDPFMFLSVPLPQLKDKMQEVTVCFAGGRAPTTFGCKVPKLGSIAELKAVLSQHSGIPAKRMAVADVWNQRIYRLLPDDSSIAEIRGNDDLWVFELPAVEEEAEGKDENRSSFVQVINQYMKPNPHHVEGNRFTKPFTLEAFGIPVLINLPKGQISNAEIHRRVAEAITPYLKENGGDLPYKVLLMDQTGRACGKCPWSANCSGCELPNNDAAADLGVSGKISFGCVWSRPQAYDEQRVKNPIRHESAPVQEAGALAAPAQSQVIQLSECIEAFSVEEVLGENDAWYCSRCRDFVQATKKMEVYRCPDVLIIHLKRFQYTRLWREKIDSLVDFPIEGLDMSHWAMSPEDRQKGAIYDLYAVSNHIGGMGGGHYTAYGKNLLDNNWYLYDDSHVAPVRDLNQIKSPEAYVLFYSRRKAQQ
eukprot:TRINITY_DN128_c0_g1_i2.p1 TRINITY_DN128_c0_g1~~TRINITY_DN128_c0_g1_i2.p1  ORF type:complete len:941 (-),score=443.20 TRINITY_DN128_c0_g1_i2:252-3074(-)